MVTEVRPHLHPSPQKNLADVAVATGTDISHILMNVYRWQFLNIEAGVLSYIVMAIGSDMGQLQYETFN